MKKITIEIIPHGSQRYETVGDWINEKNGDLTIYISDTGKWQYNLLIALHELVEVSLCNDRHISQAKVDKFDMNYKGDGEPGDDPKAPYQREHNFATGIERLMCAELGIKWADYDNTIARLYDKS